jgi:hypothetical protein
MERTPMQHATRTVVHHTTHPLRVHYGWSHSANVHHAACNIQPTNTNSLDGECTAWRGKGRSTPAAPYTIQQ